MGDYIGYIRVSSHDQGTSGLGLAAQNGAISAWLINRCNHLATTQHIGSVFPYQPVVPHQTLTPDVLLCIYREVESGRHNNRPVLRQALAHCRRVGATLVIAKLDRLARSVKLIADLLDARVPFLALDYPNADEFTLHIMAAVAQQEAKMAGDRTRAALAAARARGVLLGAAAPAWRAKVPPARRAQLAQRARAARALKIGQTYQTWRAPLLAGAQALRAQGQGYGAIAALLNREGARTLTGKPLLPVTIRDLLLGRPCDRAAQRRAQAAPAPLPSKESALF